jgi:hypothetical protein
MSAGGEAMEVPTTSRGGATTMSNTLIPRWALAVALAAGLAGASPALAKPHPSWQGVWSRLTREVTAVWRGATGPTATPKRALTIGPDGVAVAASPEDATATEPKPATPENGG